MEPYKHDQSQYTELSDPLGEHQNLSYAAAEPSSSKSEGSLQAINEPNAIVLRNTVEVV